MLMELQTEFGHYGIDRLHNSLSISSTIWAYHHVITFQAVIIILTRLSLVLPCSSKCLMDMGAGLYLKTKIVHKKRKQTVSNNKPAVAVEHVGSFSVKHF